MTESTTDVMYIIQSGNLRLKDGINTSRMAYEDGLLKSVSLAAAKKFVKRETAVSLIENVTKAIERYAFNSSTVHVTKWLTQEKIDKDIQDIQDRAAVWKNARVVQITLYED